MGIDVCDKFADITPNAPALIDILEDGSPRPYSYLELKRLSNRLANTLLVNGLSAGDRVGILLPQCPETALTHIACYKAGLIAVPLFTLFGEDALEYRLANSAATAIVTDRENMPKINAIKARLNDLRLILSIDGAEPGVRDFHALLFSASDAFTPVDSLAEDPALLIFTSGTTGPPKGALHAHRTLLGHFSGVQFMHDFFPKAGDRFWTPADWAWAGGSSGISRSSPKMRAPRRWKSACSPTTSAPSASSRTSAMWSLRASRSAPGGPASSGRTSG